MSMNAKIFYADMSVGVRTQNINELNKELDEFCSSHDVESIKSISTGKNTLVITVTYDE